MQGKLQLYVSQLFVEAGQHSLLIAMRQRIQRGRDAAPSSPHASYINHGRRTLTAWNASWAQLCGSQTPARGQSLQDLLAHPNQPGFLDDVKSAFVEAESSIGPCPQIPYSLGGANTTALGVEVALSVAGSPVWTLWTVQAVRGAAVSDIEKRSGEISGDEEDSDNSASAFGGAVAARALRGFVVSVVCIHKYSDQSIRKSRASQRQLAIADDALQSVNAAMAKIEEQRRMDSCELICKQLGSVLERRSGADVTAAEALQIVPDIAVDSSMEEAVLAMTSDLHIVYSNQHVTTITMRSAQNLFGLHLSELLQADQMQGVQEQLQRLGACTLALSGSSSGSGNWDKLVAEAEAAEFSCKLELRPRLQGLSEAHRCHVVFRSFVWRSGGHDRKSQAAVVAVFYDLFGQELLEEEESKTGTLPHQTVRATMTSDRQARLEQDLWNDVSGPVDADADADAEANASADAVTSFDPSQHLHAELDRDGVIFWCNPSFASFFGLTVKAAEGASLLQLLRSIGRSSSFERVVSDRMELLLSQRSRDAISSPDLPALLQTYTMPLQEQIRWMKWRVELHSPSQERMQRVVGTHFRVFGVDATAQMRANELIAETHAAGPSSSDQLPPGVCSFVCRPRLVSGQSLSIVDSFAVSVSCLTVLGLSQTELTEHPDKLIEQVHKEERDAFCSLLSSVLDGNEDQSILDHRFYVNKRACWFRTCAVRTKDGMCSAVMQDISSERSKQRADELKSALLGAVTEVGLAVVQLSSFRLKHVYAGMRDMFGDTSDNSRLAGGFMHLDELLARPVDAGEEQSASATSPSAARSRKRTQETQSILVSLGRELRKEGRAVREVLCCRLDGREPFWARFQCGTWLHPEWGLCCLLAVVDISERVEAERMQRAARQAAEDSARSKSSFLSTMSHEIRTPLNGVLSMASFLSDTTLDEEQLEYVSSISVCGEHLLTLINDILDFSKIEAAESDGGMELESVPLLINEIMEQAMKLAYNPEKHGTLSVTCSLQESCPANIVGDPTRLRQILVNLLSNALKFTREGGVYLHVEVLEQDAKDNQATLKFSCTDTGIGMDEAGQKRLFKVYSQASGAATTAQFGGTGLGLAISKKLAQLMGGDMGVVSAPGKGSTFWFTLRCRYLPTLDPMSSSALARGVASMDSVPLNFATGRVAALEGERIFICAKPSFVTESLSQMCRNWGMSVIAQHSSENAIEVIKTSRPIRVSILSLHEPTNLAVARALKAEHPGVAIALLDCKTTPPTRVDTELFQVIVPNPLLMSSLLQYLVATVERMKRQSQKAVEENSDPVPVVSKRRRRKKVAENPSDVEAERPCPASPTPKLLSRASKQPNRQEPRTNVFESFPLKILVAEDNKINQTIIRKVLGQLGFANVMVVNNGRFAVEAVRNEQVDVVFMDMQMPEMDGIEATQLIRRGSENAPGPDMANLIIVAMTANVMEEDRKRCFEAGMNDFVSKPLDFKVVESLLLKYGRILEASRRAKANPMGLRTSKSAATVEAV